MKVRLYLDEDSTDNHLVQALRARHVDVVTAFEVGMVGTADDQQVRYATKLERSLYSFNVRYFWKIHAEFVKLGKAHAGMVLARQQRYSVKEQMRRLLRIISEVSAEEMRDRVEFLSHW